MSYELDIPTPNPRVYSPEERTLIATTLRFLAEEYVMAANWPRADQLLTIGEQHYAEATTADDLEEWMAKISFAMKSLLVRDCWKAYRQGLRDTANSLSLDPGGYKQPQAKKDADPE
jgi:hypothetical protein